TIPNQPVKTESRSPNFFRIMSVLATRAEHGMWTLQRYGQWLEKRTQWFVPGQTPETPDGEMEEVPAPAIAPLVATTPKPVLQESKQKVPTATAGSGGRIEIEPIESGFGKILK